MRKFQPMIITETKYDLNWILIRRKIINLKPNFSYNIWQKYCEIWDRVVNKK